MTSTTVLLVGGTKSKAFIPSLQKRYTVLMASSGNRALTLADKYPVQIIVLDSISMRTSGERVCRLLCDRLPHIPVIHIHSGSKKETASPADILLFHPFTSRKLVNAIERLLRSDNDTIIRCGPFTINIASRVLIAHGQEMQLTPKQTRLAEIFLRNPGRILDRKMLMNSVWKTDYLGDTRTLDVHIRWIRKALENGSGKPRYLKTVRGVGYRLDIEDT